MENINSDLECLTEEQEHMRRDLRYHFMNPKEKWQAKGTLPFKFTIIILKVIFITFQLIVFSDNYVNQVSFAEGSKTTFRNLFLLGWDSSQETPSYPPSHGPFAIYTKEKYFNSLSHALKQYYTLEKIAIGPYSFGDHNEPNAFLCVTNYNVSTIFPFNRTYKYSSSKTSKCIHLSLNNGSGDDIYDVSTYLKNHNFSIDFNGLINSTLTFVLRSIELKYFEIDEVPSCSEFKVLIVYDNSNHNGQVIISLQTKVRVLECQSHLPKSALMQDLVEVLDSFCIIFSIISWFLCLRSVIRLYRFWKRSKKFFRLEMNVDISDKWTYFFSVSYILILIGDMCNVTGSILKLHILQDDNNHLFNRNLNNVIACSYFLGLGLFLGYCTIIRYCSYFPKSSILVNTIKFSLPPLLRFSLCSIILYMAFSLFGWVILGPYHIKFQTLRSSMACLFSLMNGDDMYVTLTIINEDNTAIVIFSQIYIYLFCILFIFVVLNLILTIIIEAYDHVKQRLYINNFTHDAFWNFINSCPESATSSKFRNDLKMERSLNQQYQCQMIRKFIDTICCCFGKGGHVQELLAHQHHGHNHNVTVHVDEASCNENDNEIDGSHCTHIDRASSLFSHSQSPLDNECYHSSYVNRHLTTHLHHPTLSNCNYGSMVNHSQRNYTKIT